MRNCANCGENRQVMVAMMSATRDGDDWHLCVPCYIKKDKTDTHHAEVVELPPHPSRKAKRKK